MGKHKTSLAVLGFLMLSATSAAAAPNGNKNTDYNPQVQVTDDAYNHQRENTYESTDKNFANPETHREKRWFNYGFPPFQGNPLPFPPDFGKETSLSTQMPEDPLAHIYSRLQDISTIVRQPALPPPPAFHLPVYLPIFVYYPQISCNCPTQPPKTNGSRPGIDNRFPEMEDSRQNWGFFMNDTIYNDADDDYIRPISFEPISPNRTLNRPPPPVEHGSMQASANDTNQVESLPGLTTQSPLDPPKASAPIDPPTTCDGAVLSCCHQPKVTYECFSSLGCQDIGYGDPCEAKTILSVIDRFQRYYRQNNT